MTTTTAEAQYPPKPIQTATYAARVLSFLAALAMFGAFFLPWIHLDGYDTPATGAQLIAIILSPEFGYLNTVSQLQALLIVGCPFLMFVAVAIVSLRKFQREPSPVGECIILVSAGVVAYVPTELTSPNADLFYSGLFVIVAVAAILLTQDLLTYIRDRAKLGQRAPGVDNVLGVISGSGQYEWAW